MVEATKSDHATGVEGLTRELARQEERLLACVHCGFCLGACPTYTRLGDEADSPRGRLYLMRAVVEGRLEPGSDDFARHLDRCLGCRACETVCPSGVEYGFLLERARSVIAGARGVPPATRALLRVFRSGALTRIALGVGRLLRGTRLLPALIRALPRRFGPARLGLAMLGASRPWPRLERTDEVAAERPGAAASASATRPRTPTRGRVAMLTGCVQRGLFARVNRATARVLRANGFEVVAVPGQGCCGALHAHAGDLQAARELARRNVEAFGLTGLDAVIVNAAGCSAMLKEYGELLGDEPHYAERARALSGRTRDIFEFLDEVGPVAGAPLPLRAAYDAPCHLHHAQRVQAAPLRVLATVPGLEVTPLPHYEECCGGAGIYGITHPELGGRILADKVREARGSGADVVVTGNPGCIMQIGAGLLLEGDRRPVLHPVELLAESYRRAGGGG